MRDPQCRPSSEETTGDKGGEYEEDDLWWLELLFTLLFLPTKKHSSPGWMYLNVFTCLHSCFVGYGQMLFILMIRVLQESNVTQIFASVWAFSVTTVYLILSYQQRQTPDLVERLRTLSRPGSHPLLVARGGTGGTGGQSSPHASKVPVLAALFAWLLNVVFVVMDTRTVVTENFGLSHNIVFIVFVACSSFHIHLLCWFAPVPIVCTACYYVSARTKAVHGVFATEFSRVRARARARDGGEGGGEVQVLSLSELYMELYELNHTLNACVSFLFTFVVATMSFVFLFVILVS